MSEPNNQRDGKMTTPSGSPHASETTPPDQGCKVPPPGWYCSRQPGHKGPCAARPLLLDDATEICIDNLLWAYAGFIHSANPEESGREMEYDDARRALRLRIAGLSPMTSPRSPLPTSEMTPEQAEVLDALESANRLFHGWHFDGLWSEYDESVRQKVQRVLNKLRGMPEHIDMEMPHTAASPPSLEAPAEKGLLIEDILTPERLSFMAKHGGMALPHIEVQTSIGVVTLEIIARPDWIKRPA